MGLKNDGGQAKDLVDYFDFELNEECHRYQECGELSVFTSLILPWDLDDSFRGSCDQ